MAHWSGWVIFFIESEETYTRLNWIQTRLIHLFDIKKKTNDCHCVTFFPASQIHFSYRISNFNIPSSEWSWAYPVQTLAVLFCVYYLTFVPNINVQAKTVEKHTCHDLAGCEPYLGFHWFWSSLSFLLLIIISFRNEHLCFWNPAKRQSHIFKWFNFCSGIKKRRTLTLAPLWQ